MPAQNTEARYLDMMRKNQACNHSSKEIKLLHGQERKRWTFGRLRIVEAGGCFTVSVGNRLGLSFCTLEDVVYSEAIRDWMFLHGTDEEKQAFKDFYEEWDKFHEFLSGWDERVERVIAKGDE